MQNNKKIKLVILFISFIMLVSLNKMIYAAADPITNPDSYKPTASTSETKLQKKAGKILGVVNVVGVIVSVVTLVCIGIRYLIGSVEEKAEYKKTEINYLIGAILVFSVTTIPNILYTIAQEF